MENDQEQTADSFCPKFKFTPVTVAFVSAKPELPNTFTIAIATDSTPYNTEPRQESQLRVFHVPVQG
jgi:hypothetical protein